MTTSSLGSLVSLPNKLCLECEKKFTGRSDKKFCSDACRIAHHNKTHKVDSNIVKKTDRILHNNYAVLKKLNAKGKRKILLTTLKRHGVDMNYHTSHYNSEKGIYYYCYDQGYVEIKPGLYLLVEKN